MFIIWLNIIIHIENIKKTKLLKMKNKMEMIKRCEKSVNKPYEMN